MLSYLGLSVTISSLLDAVPSLWVALLEGLLDTKLNDIYRDPQLVTDRGSRIHNTQIVISTLEILVLQMPLPHILPTAVVEGDVQTLLHLTDLFYQLYLQLSKNTSSFQPFDTPTATPLPTEKHIRFEEEESELLSQAQSPISFQDQVSQFLGSPTRTIDEFQSENTKESNNYSQQLNDYTQVLAIRPLDTPYMKALKMKQSRLLKEKANLPVTINDPSNKGLPPSVEEQFKKVLQDHKTTHGPIDLGPLKRAHLPPDPPRPPKPVPTSQAEKNLDVFLERISKRVPMLGQFPRFDEKERVWNGQIQTWKKALDDRLWTQKVVLVFKINLAKTIE